MRKEDVGKRLRIFREARSITQQELADKLGVTRLTITRYELGQLSLGVESIERLITVYGVNVAWLLTGDGAMFISMVTTSQKMSPELEELCRHLQEHAEDIQLFLKLIHGKKIVGEALEEIYQSHHRNLKHKHA